MSRRTPVPDRAAQLLQLGRTHSPIHYDAARGLSRFRRLAAAQPTPAPPAGQSGAGGVTLSWSGFLGGVAIGAVTALALITVVRLTRPDGLAPSVFDPQLSAPTAPQVPEAMPTADAGVDQAPSAPMRVPGVPSPAPPAARAPETQLPRHPDGAGERRPRHGKLPSRRPGRDAPRRTVTQDAPVGDPVEVIAPPEAAPTTPKPEATSGVAPVHPAPADASPQGPIFEEAALVARAERMLATAPSRTLVLLQIADRRFPAGLLQQERAYLNVRARHRLGEAGVASEARAFLRRYPRGPFAQQVRVMLRESDAR